MQRNPTAKMLRSCFMCTSMKLLETKSLRLKIEIAKKLIPGKSATKSQMSGSSSLKNLAVKNLLEKLLETFWQQKQYINKVYCKKSEGKKNHEHFFRLLKVPRLKNENNFEAEKLALRSLTGWISFSILTKKNLIAQICSKTICFPKIYLQKASQRKTWW